jgi:ribosomal protein S18 acetylase RimI-like enzyme
MSSILVRAARPDDYGAIARLTVAAYRADGQLEGEHGYEQVLADVAARAGAGELLVAEDQATTDVVGSVLFVLPRSAYSERAGAGEAEFRMLAVDPSAQRRGVGEALVQACIAHASERSCNAIVISVRDFTERAHRLYARLGFTRVPEKDWSPVPGVDLIAMRLDLAPRG